MVLKSLCAAQRARPRLRAPPPGPRPDRRGARQHAAQPGAAQVFDARAQPLSRLPPPRRVRAARRHPADPAGADLRALAEELERLNRRPRCSATRAGGLARPLRRCRRPPTGRSSSCPTPTASSSDGDILVDSELLLPEAGELGVGERTRHITTLTSGQQHHRAGAARWAAGQTPHSRAVAARIVYDDDHRPPHLRRREGLGDGRPRRRHLSRRHQDRRVGGRVARARAHPPRPGRATVLPDRSQLARHDAERPARAARLREVDGSKRENGAETPLPDRARIGLAETVFLDFSGCVTTVAALRAIRAAGGAGRSWRRATSGPEADRVTDARHAGRIRLPRRRRHRPRPAGATSTRIGSTATSARGLFIVIDGVGGQAAGGKAADVALAMLRARLERETGPVADRLREAITIANNEIHCARRHPARVERHGLRADRRRRPRRPRDHRPRRRHAAVQAARRAASRRSRAITRRSASARTPTRSRKPRRCAIRGATRSTATSGPSRTQPDDPDFVDVDEIDVRARCGAAALQRRADRSGQLGVHRRASSAPHAGDPPPVVDGAHRRGQRRGRQGQRHGGLRRGPAVRADAGALAEQRRPRAHGRRRGRRLTAVASAAATLQPLLAARSRCCRSFVAAAGAARSPLVDAGRASRRPGESIAAAIERAAAGHRRSSSSRASTASSCACAATSGSSAGSRAAPRSGFRSPPRGRAAVVASGVTDAELVGFRIVGDAATPLGRRRLFATDASVSIHDVEISGATRVAIDLRSGARGVARRQRHSRQSRRRRCSIRAGATPRIRTTRSPGTARRPRRAHRWSSSPGAEPVFYRNVFQAVTSEASRPARRSARVAVAQDNWFIRAPAPERGPRRGARRARR